MVATGCSTQKNTSATRRWHAFKARYNTYFNGSQAYIDASLEKEDGNQDNYTEMLPLYTVGNKSSREIGKANYERAIEKCQKTIKQHSIKRRPKWTKSRRKTDKDIEWLSRREYNPFLWRAWLLMGRSQFYKGSFDEAASTFAYMSRLYKTQPAIYGKARAWLAKSYIEEGWLYDAEDVIRGMQRDSMHWSARKEWDYTYADYYIHAQQYDKAVPYLRNVIKHEMRRKQRAREWYLMGQLQTALGNRQEAMKAFRHVIRLNPPYQLEFNARISMTEVMSEGQSRKMIGRLKRMARSDKNKDYLDQVYYAIGNIYMAQRDTIQAIKAYERGAAKATRSGIEKGVLLLRLGDIYWDMERYNDAQRCYGEAIGQLDKERPDYEQLSKRSKVLDQLVPYTDAIHLQDSLQALAKMSEADRNAAIDRTIEALKKKEREERRAQAERAAEEAMQQNGGSNVDNNNASSNTMLQNGQKSLWYFYNPMAVQQGKQTFQKLWGKRANVDNWQRVNKTVVAFESAAEPEITQEQRDSIYQAELAADSIAAIADSAQNNPHRREYYMAQIPFNPEQVKASNEIIADGLFNAGVMFKDKLDNLSLAEKNLLRLTGSYADFEKTDEAYYHLYLLYMRKRQATVANTYIDRLKQQYPNSDWTTLLSDPYFVENARLGVHIEDSLYAATYAAFKASRYNEVSANVEVSQQRFPLGANRDRFVFIGGLGKLNNGDADGCLADMNKVVLDYPQSKVAEMAGMIVKGVKEGRRLRGGKFDLDGIWQRRSVVLNDNDSTAAQQLNDDRNASFVYMIAYKPDSVDENRMLFELARYNFTSYMVRNFDIGVEEVDGLHRMMVSGFRNYDEVLQYARQLQRQTHVMQLLGKSRILLISEPNLVLLGRQYSYDDYAEFYRLHFAPLQISTDLLLDMPTEVATPDERRQRPADADDSDIDDSDAQSTSTTINTFVDEKPEASQKTTSATGTIDLDDEPASGSSQQQTIVSVPDVETPPSKSTEQNAGSETIVIDEPTKPSTSETVVPNEPQPSASESTATPGSETIVIDEPTKPSTSETVVPGEPQPSAEDKAKESKQLEDEFYFGDEPSATTKGKNQNQPQSVGTDDEYYELDGF